MERLNAAAQPIIMDRLNAAAQAGDIDALYALIREDAYLLEHIDKVPFVDTPLHIAASSGNTDFAMGMVNLMPSYGRKLNQDGFSPLHLALFNKKTDLVLCLVKHDKDLIRVKGRNGMTPFHYAAEQENLNLLAEFLVACPHCIKDVTFQGETSLHIALKKKNFVAFEVVVGWIRRSSHADADNLEDKILNWRDNRGNSVLHIAAVMGQAEQVRLLLQSWLVDVDAKNMENLGALDIAKHNMEITKMLHSSQSFKLFVPRVQILPDHLKSKISKVKMIRITFERSIESIKKNGTRDALLVVFTLVLAANYDATLSPPGGLWQSQQDHNTVIPRLHIFPSQHSQQNSSLPPAPAQAQAPTPLGTVVMDTYFFFVIWSLNTSAILIILSLILLLFPNGSRKLLSLPLYLMLSCYVWSMSVISPDREWSTVNQFLFQILTLIIYILVWFWPIFEIRARTYKRQWGSSYIL